MSVPPLPSGPGSFHPPPTPRCRRLTPRPRAPAPPRARAPPPRPSPHVALRARAPRLLPAPSPGGGPITEGGAGPDGRGRDLPHPGLRAVGLFTLEPNDGCVGFLHAGAKSCSLKLLSSKWGTPKV